MRAKELRMLGVWVKKGGKSKQWPVDDDGVSQKDSYVVMWISQGDPI